MPPKPISHEGKEAQEVTSINTLAQKTAAIFLNAWITKTPISLTHELPHPQPRSVEEVYQTHDAMISLVNSNEKYQSFLGGLVGYKLGAAGLVDGEPCFYGPLFRRYVVTAGDASVDCPSGSSLPSISEINCHTLEAEIGFILQKSLPPKQDNSPYTLNEVWDSIGSIVCCVELCGHRMVGEAAANVSILGKLSDGLMTGGVLIGDPISPRSWGMSSLKNVKTCIRVNGDLRCEGGGENVPFGGPLESLTWLVNILNGKGKMLEKGKLVISGATCKITDFNAGDEVKVVFRGLSSEAEELCFKLGV